MDNIEFVDVTITGVGIQGGAHSFILSHYTNIKSIRILEKESGFGLINSHFNSNSQTLHVGDIETNYSKEKSAEVERKTDPLIRYVKKFAGGCFKRQGKMVIGVGKKEVQELRARYADVDFQKLYPELRLVERDELADLEPKIMEGRSDDEPIIALYTSGYTVNFQGVAESFITEAKKASDKDIQVYTNCELTTITKIDGGYKITTKDGRIIHSRTVVIAASGRSLFYAKSLGYGKHLGTLPIGGNFYYVRKQGLLRNKVYTVQAPGLPFAAKHGDPEFFDQSVTRFGPTARFLPSLMQLVWTWKGFKTVFKIASDRILFLFMLKNMIYDIPKIGIKSVLKDLKKIVPTLEVEDLEISIEAHGTRDQVYNSETAKLEMGDVCVIGDNILFEVTPSPGASVCMSNAYNGAQKIISFLGGNAEFLHNKWEADFKN